MVENVNSEDIQCPFCNSIAGFVYVQSHYQCIDCKQVVDPCCSGECEDESSFRD